MILESRFRTIEQLPPVYSFENEFHDEMPDKLQSCFDKLVYTNMRTVDSMVFEFYQKHVPCVPQEFRAVELVRWDKAPGSQVPGIDFLLVESTGRQNGEYRRIAQLGVRKSPVPEEEAVGSATYRGTILENKAYDEVLAARWKKRSITLI